MNENIYNEMAEALDRYGDEDFDDEDDDDGEDRNFSSDTDYAEELLEEKIREQQRQALREHRAELAQIAENEDAQLKLFLQKIDTATKPQLITKLSDMEIASALYNMLHRAETSEKLPKGWKAIKSQNEGVFYVGVKKEKE